MAGRYSRRGMMAMTGAMLAMPGLVRAAEPFRLGLTPVFLDNDAEVLARLRAALGQGTGRDIELEQRRTYQEITGLVLEGAVDAAWTCGFPYVQHEDAFTLVGVPLWQGKPLYRSYLITAPDDPATSLIDLKGGSHTFSDPDSNSGYLVTASDLARMGIHVEDFFGRTIFAYGHRNVVRSVAGGLTRSGSVDGYVWEALSVVEPALTARTKVIAKSELLGFPPIVSRNDRANSDAVVGFKAALLNLGATDTGKAALDLLQLDGFVAGSPPLFDGIRARMRDLASLK